MTAWFAYHTATQAAARSTVDSRRQLTTFDNDVQCVSARAGDIQVTTTAHLRTSIAWSHPSELQAEPHRFRRSTVPSRDHLRGIKRLPMIRGSQCKCTSFVHELSLRWDLEGHNQDATASRVSCTIAAFEP